MLFGKYRQTVGVSNGSVEVSYEQKIKGRIETLKCTSIRNISLIKCLLLRLFCKFAVG